MLERKINMKKILTILFSFINLNLYSQILDDVSYKGYAEYLMIRNKVITLDYYDFKARKNVNIISDFNIINDNGIPFLQLTIRQQNKKWLFLNSSDFIVAYKNDSDSYFLGGIGTSLSFNDVRKATYTSTSFLIEKNNRYTPENLGTTEPNKPWVEGVKGSGIGEKLFLKLQHWIDKDGKPGGIGALILSNGYVSFSNPSLYYKNNRVKEFLVTSKSPDFSFIQRLTDTPNPQFILLPAPTSEITLKIVSIYPGNQWDDTCVNFILTLDLNQSKRIKAK